MPITPFTKPFKLMVECLKIDHYYQTKGRFVMLNAEFHLQKPRLTYACVSIALEQQKQG